MIRPMGDEKAESPLGDFIRRPAVRRGLAGDAN